MKVSGPLSQPFRFCSHGEQPISRVCRHFVNMGSAVESPLTGEQKVWWTRFGQNFSPDILPDEYLLVTDKSMLSDAVQEVDTPINPPENRLKPLPVDCMLAEQNEQKHRLAQVDVSFSDGQCLDRSETLQDQSNQRNGGSVLEEPANHGSFSADADSLCSDGESQPQSMLFHCGNRLSEEALEASGSARVKVLCSFGGRIMPRPVDGKLRYVGGDTRIIAVNKHTSFSDFMSKMAQLYGAASLGIKYQLPDEDLDALVSVSSEDDLQNMMEEYDKVASCGSASRLRLFFFLTPAEIQVCEMKTEGEEGCSCPDQQYVDAINGVSGKFHVTLLEDDGGVTRQVDEGNFVDGNGQTPPFEHANELPQSKGPSAPSSSPSSPSLASHQAPYHKPPGSVDFSLQTLHDRLNKVTMAPHILEGASEYEGSGKFSSPPFHRHNDQHQYDQQFSLHADSPQVLHHELLALQGENRSDFCHFDSQTKFARQSEQFPECWMNGGRPTDHWHDMHISRETVLPHGEHQRIFPQMKQSACVQQPSLPPPHYQQQQQQHHNHHQQVVYHHHHQQQPIQQQQQGRSPQIDGDSGRAEQAQHDMHKQQQVIHPHHLHHNLSIHDRCSWNAEFHGQSVEHNPVPPFIHGSSQINPQILHGLAPVPPYQIGSAPPSPRLGLYDFQGKCSCGLQHSQVHRGITVSIGEQSHSRWPPHYGDQAVRKQGFRNSPRFYDSASHATDSPMWQNTSHTNYTPETDHRDVGSHWQHYVGRHPGDFHLADCQTRSRALQYSEYPAQEVNFRPNHERPDTNMRCLCSTCNENRRQPVETTIGHSAYSEVPDVVPEWVLHRKGFDSDAGRLSSARRPFPRVPVHKEEDQRGDHANDRFIEGESGLFVPQLPGDSESRRTMGSHVDGVHHGRKLTYPLGALPNKFPASNEPSAHQLSGQHDWYPSPKSFVGLPRNRSEVNLHPHKQNSTRLFEAGNTSLSHEISRTNLVSTSPVVMEDIDSSDGVALLSDSQPRNYGAFAPQSFCREESCTPGTEGVVIGVAPLHSFATSGLQFVDVSCSSPMIAAGRADNHLLSPDVIPLGHVSLTTQSGQAVPASVPVVGNMQQETTAAIYEQSLPNSGNVIKFSFAGPDKTKLLPSLEENTDNKPLPSKVSAMEILADGTIPLVLESGLNKELSHEIPKAILEVAYTDSPKVLKDQAIYVDVASSNTLKSPVLEQEVSTLKDISVGNGFEGAIAENMIHTVQNEELTNTSHQERDSEAGVLGKEDCNTPSLSQAEAEAISHGLQIIKNSDLEDLKELGSGTYGTVYHGKWKGSDVAIKRIKASCFNGPPSERERLISDFWREACTLGQLHHPNVVAFYGVVPDGPGGTLATVTEYMVNGSLKQVLHKKDRTIDRRKRLFIAMDAAFGMEYLHSKNIVHFDLKCENLLVNMRDAHRPICKVGDFGLSKVKHHTLVSGGVRGTLPWMAPELLSGNCSMVSEKIDVFSFGIVMWELLTGEEPYENMHCGAIIGGIVNDTLRPSIPSWCDPGWRSLMERCWSRNPIDRPAFTEVARELRAIAATMNLK